ncbi:hypothetical protein C8J26_3106 [Sphingomonas aurantiaca]|uniref:Uncharacterized protein n=1 Tax=Sphingomonas aurantiaca TaxID=185949 RepID=A0A2T5GJ75_9SPHN|nr:hypothetical protein [Sphingomonas aurantiaca]PTQ59362.1 hypothetical protein C8J26_3106 [Sphingomonas aurantiaca]
MPISLADFAVAIVLLFGVPLLLVLVAKRNRRWAAWCGAWISVFILVGNAVEKLATGQSGLF